MTKKMCKRSTKRSKRMNSASRYKEKRKSRYYGLDATVDTDSCTGRGGDPPSGDERGAVLEHLAAREGLSLTEEDNGKFNFDGATQILEDKKGSGT